MIHNERQYRITKAQADKMREALAQSETAAPAKGVHPKLQKAATEGLRAQVGELDQEIREYDDLKAGRGRKHLNGALTDLGTVLIKARIARGWTQRELADRLGLHMQKIQQYEASEYAGASLTRLQDVARVLGLVFTGRGELLELPRTLAPPTAAAGGKEIRLRK